MKANEAPEKLYIALNELDEDERTFVLDHRVDYPICTEYTRTDAFVEKAVSFIRNCTTYDGLGYKAKCVNIEKFIEVMKR